jgi:transcriptional regulator with XRE-family HTH domain
MSFMSNERMRTALAQAGLSATELASKLDVDPKTVERWINPGRRPYLKKAHQAAAVLGRDPEWLWPGLGQVKGKEDSEILAVYPERAAVPRDLWIRLLQDARHGVDVLVFSGTFFAQTNPGVAAMLRAAAERGVHVRLCFGDPRSEAVAKRGDEEGIGAALGAKIEASLTYYRGLTAVEGCDVRLHSSTLYASIFRYDNTLLFNPHIWGQPASANPVIHVRCTDAQGLFQHYERGFDTVWQTAMPWAND